MSTSRLTRKNLRIGLATMAALSVLSCAGSKRTTYDAYRYGPDSSHAAGSTHAPAAQNAPLYDARDRAEPESIVHAAPSQADSAGALAPPPGLAPMPGAPSAESYRYELEDESDSIATSEWRRPDRDRRDSSGEGYARVPENPFVSVDHEPLSTFSTDVDTASYANVRRFLDDGQSPPPNAVRIEELVNYFDYDYPTPRSSDPVALYGELADCPWNPDHQLLHLGLSTEKIRRAAVPPRNLVFLLDVSGSMSSRDKLPLLKHGLSMLVEDLRSEDSVAIVVYAGATGLVLPPTDGDDRGEIFEALENLEAGGSTNGGAGIELAYRVAERNFVEDGINRVILATDGDFNVGVSSKGGLTRLIEEKRDGGVFLTVLGFGRGNLQDHKMEALADHGNGNYAYIDSPLEAQKVLVREAGATLVTAAKDVKVQIEFNPAHVSSYRLVGYENRMLRDRDFNDDRKDAGDMGAGHTVTALYEIVPAGARSRLGDVDPLRYEKKRRSRGERGHRTTTRVRRGHDDTGRSHGSELATFKVRYKHPDGNRSRLIEARIKNQPTPMSRTSDRFRFSAAVATFGLVLRNSRHRGEADLPLATRLAGSSLGRDPDGDRAEFLDLVKLASHVTD
jgi:Ca-activated chloride channel homolog